MQKDKFDALSTDEKLDYLFREIHSLINFSNRLGANIGRVNQLGRETEETVRELARSVEALRAEERKIEPACAD